jgi:hypothetical protein
MSYSYNTKQEAEQAALKTLSRMKTKGWSIRTHQNTGWFYNLNNKTLYLSEGFDGSFHCLLSSGRYPNSGEAYWTTNNAFEDPNDAVEDQMNVAKAFADKINGVIQNLENSLAGKSI